MRQQRRQGPAALRQVQDRQEDRHRRRQPYQHGRRAARACRQPDPQGARIHPARAARHHHRLRLRPRGPVAPHRLLQMRRRWSRAPTSCAANSACPKPASAPPTRGSISRRRGARKPRPFAAQPPAARPGHCPLRAARSADPWAAPRNDAPSIEVAAERDRERHLFHHIHRLSCRHVVEKRSLQIPELLCRNQPMRESSLQISCRFEPTPEKAQLWIVGCRAEPCRPAVSLTPRSAAFRKVRLT